MPAVVTEDPARMTELKLLGFQGVPEGCLLSLRLGSTRRLAPLAADRLFRFPDGGGGVSAGAIKQQLKVEVYSQVGVARLLLEPGSTDRCSVPLMVAGGGGKPTLPEMLLDFGITRPGAAAVTAETSAKVGKVPADGAEEGTSEPLKPSSGARRHQVALEAQPYFEQHGLLDVIQTLLQAVIKDKPPDPYVYMIRLLENSCRAATPQAKRETDATQTFPRRPATAESSPPAPEAADLELKLSGIDFGLLGDATKESLVDGAVSHVAELAGVPKECVRDLQGKPGSVSLSSGSLVVQGRVELPQGYLLLNLTEALSTTAALQKFQETVAAVPGVAAATTGPLSASVSVKLAPPPAPEEVSAAQQQHAFRKSQGRVSFSGELPTPLKTQSSAGLKERNVVKFVQKTDVPDASDDEKDQDGIVKPQRVTRSRKATGFARPANMPAEDEDEEEEEEEGEDKIEVQAAPPPKPSLCKKDRRSFEASNLDEGEEQIAKATAPKASVRLAPLGSDDAKKDESGDKAARTVSINAEDASLANDSKAPPRSQTPHAGKDMLPPDEDEEGVAEALAESQREMEVLRQQSLASLQQWASAASSVEDSAEQANADSAAAVFEKDFEGFVEVSGDPLVEDDAVDALIGCLSVAGSDALATADVAASTADAAALVRSLCCRVISALADADASASRGSADAASVVKPAVVKADAASIVSAQEVADTASVVKPASVKADAASIVSAQEVADAASIVKPAIVKADAASIVSAQDVADAASIVKAVCTRMLAMLNEVVEATPRFGKALTSVAPPARPVPSAQDVADAATLVQGVCARALVVRVESVASIAVPVDDAKADAAALVHAVCARGVDRADAACLVQKVCSCCLTALAKPIIEAPPAARPAFRSAPSAYDVAEASALVSHLCARALASYAPALAPKIDAVAAAPTAVSAQDLADAASLVGKVCARCVAALALAPKIDAVAASPTAVSAQDLADAASLVGKVCARCVAALALFRRGQMQAPKIDAVAAAPTAVPTQDLAPSSADHAEAAAIVNGVCSGALAAYASCGQAQAPKAPPSEPTSAELADAAALLVHSICARRCAVLTSRLPSKAVPAPSAHDVADAAARVEAVCAGASAVLCQADTPPLASVGVSPAPEVRPAPSARDVADAAVLVQGVCARMLVRVSVPVVAEPLPRPTQVGSTMPQVRPVPSAQDIADAAALVRQVCAKASAFGAPAVAVSSPSAGQNTEALKSHAYSCLVSAGETGHLCTALDNIEGTAASVARAKARNLLVSAGASGVQSALEEVNMGQAIEPTRRPSIVPVYDPREMALRALSDAEVCGHLPQLLVRNSSCGPYALAQEMLRTKALTVLRDAAANGRLQDDDPLRPRNGRKLASKSAPHVCDNPLRIRALAALEQSDSRGELQDRLRGAACEVPLDTAALRDRAATAISAAETSGLLDGALRSLGNVEENSASCQDVADAAAFVRDLCVRLIVEIGVVAAPKAQSDGSTLAHDPVLQIAEALNADAATLVRDVCGRVLEELKFEILNSLETADDLLLDAEVLDDSMSRITSAACFVEEEKTKATPQDFQVDLAVKAAPAKASPEPVGNSAAIVWARQALMDAAAKGVLAELLAEACKEPPQAEVEAAIAEALSAASRTGRLPQLLARLGDTATADAAALVNTVCSRSVAALAPSPAVNVAATPTKKSRREVMPMSPKRAAAKEQVLHLKAENDELKTRTAALEGKFDRLRREEADLKTALRKNLDGPMNLEALRKAMR